VEDALQRPSEQLSTEESENFWRNGCNALTAETQPPSGIAIGANNAYLSVAVDVPAVGITPDYEMPSIQRSAAEYVSGAVPDPLRALIDRGEFGSLLSAANENIRRDCALVELLFAARDLAEHDIMRPDTDSVFRHSPWCTKCQMSEQGGSIPHAHSCKTGRVFKALEELQSVACRVGAHKIPDRMDLAQRDGEQGGAQ
jgi:hypothetical protein